MSTKKILWLILLCSVPMLSFAQDPLKTKIDSLFQNLNHSIMSTRFLIDRTLPISQIAAFDGVGTTAIKYPAWRQVYLDLQNADYDNSLTSIEDIAKLAFKKRSHDTVPIGIMHFNYDKIKPYAVDSNLLSYDSTSETFSDISSRTESPYYTIQVFTACPMTNQVHSGTYKFQLGGNFFFSNLSPEYSSIQIDFGDGEGPRTASIGDYFTITYEDTGTVNLSLVVVYGGTTFTSNSFMKVTEVTGIPTDEQHFIQASIDYPDGSGIKARGYYVRRSPSNRPCNLKPLIMLDGIDLGNEGDPHDGRIGDHGWADIVDPNWQYESLDHFYKEFHYMPDLIHDLTDNNYDIYFLDYSKGADWIQRNAMLLVELIKDINQNIKDHQSTCGCSEDIVILAPSMGGVLARYALAYMEKHNMEHHVRLYASIDAPHQGANVPIGAQYFISYFSQLSETARDNKEKLLKPAAKQCLISHFESFDGSVTGPNSARSGFLSDLRDIGWYPQQMRKVALANGSMIGTHLPGFDAGDNLIEYHWSGSAASLKCWSLPLSFLYYPVQIFGYAWSVPGGTANGYPNTVFFGGTPKTTTHIVQVPSSTPTYDNCAGSTNNALKQFQGQEYSIVCDGGTIKYGKMRVNQPNFSFIPSMSALDIGGSDRNIPSTLYTGINPTSPFTVNYNINGYLTDRINPLPDKYPFEAFYGQNSDQIHIEATTENIGWLVDQVTSNEHDLIGLPALAGGSLKYTYNFGSTRRTLYGMNVNPGCTLQVNGNYNTDFGSGDAPVSNFPFTVTTSYCADEVRIGDNSGSGTAKFIIGDISSPSSYQGTVIFRSGSVLHLAGNSHLIINNGSKVIIEKDATIIYDDGATIDLLGTSAILEIRGKLQLGSNATFTLSSSSTGFIRFHQEYPPEHNILVTGTNCQFILTGTGNKVLEVTGGEGVDPEDGLALFKINSGRVLMDANCRLNIGCPLDLSDVTIDALKSGTDNYHRGLHIYGQSSVSITSTEIDHGSYGIFALQNYGGNGVTLSSLKVSDCVTGVHSEGQWINFVSRCSLINCTNTAWEAYEMDNSSSTFSDSYIDGPSSSSSALGIYYQAASSSAPLVIDQSRIQNNFIGIDIFSTDAQVSCSKVENNTYGIVQWDGSLNMSPNQTPAGGSTSLMGNNTSLFVSGGASFDISDGGNSFDAGTGGYTIDGTLGYCFSPMVYIADWNYWPGGGYPTGVNATQFCSGTVTPFAVSAFYAYSSPIIYSCYTGPTPIGKRDVVQLSDTIVYPTKDSTDYQIDSARINIKAGKCLKASRTLFDMLNNHILSSGNDAAFLKTYKGMMYGIHKAIENKEINPDTTVVPGIIDSVRSLQVAAAKQFKDNSSLEFLRYLLLSDRAGLFAITNQRDSSISILENMRSWVTDQQLKQVNLYECHIIAEDSVKKGISKKEDFERLIKPCHPSKDTLLSTPQQPTFNSITKESRKSKSGLILYPNPSSGDVNALITLPSSGNTNIRIYNMEGKLVETLTNLKLTQGENSVKLPVAGQISGLYMISVEGNNFSFKEKLIKH